MIDRTQDEWCALVARLQTLPRETEWVEFKMNNKDPERIGKYVSGLSNAIRNADVVVIRSYDFQDKIRAKYEPRKSQIRAA